MLLNLNSCIHYSCIDLDMLNGSGIQPYSNYFIYITFLDIICCENIGYIIIWFESNVKTIFRNIVIETWRCPVIGNEILFEASMTIYILQTAEHPISCINLSRHSVFVCLHFYMHRKCNKEIICFYLNYNNKAVATAESKRGIISFLWHLDYCI